ncbi:MAG: STAS domain-containing protein [Candidatus Riflebacteria bacterium]|nr:STAS domain-containing protein [Candidatus Riflebacteria bacterium]
MKIELNSLGNVYLFTLHGSLDYTASLKLLDAVTPHIGISGQKILLDFSEVSLVNSMGYVMLLRLLKASQTNGSLLKFCNLQGVTRESFELMRFDDFKQATSSRDEVLKTLQA